MSGDVAALDFAGGGAGEGVGDVDFFGNFEVSEAAVAERHNVVGLGIATEHDGAVYFFTILGIGDGEANGFRDAGMLEQNGIDFQGRDFLPAAVDQFLQPASERQIAVGVENALITSAKIAAAEGAGVGLGIVAIAVHHVFALDRDFALLSAGQLIAPVVENDDFDARAAAH